MSIEDTIRAAVREAISEAVKPQAEWLAPHEVATMLGLKPQTVYSKIKRGVIPAHDFDGRLYVSRSELDAAMRSAPAPRKAA